MLVNQYQGHQIKFTQGMKFFQGQFYKFFFSNRKLSLLNITFFVKAGFQYFITIVIKFNFHLYRHKMCMYFHILNYLKTISFLRQKVYTRKINDQNFNHLYKMAPFFPQLYSTNSDWDQSP